MMAFVAVMMGRQEREEGRQTIVGWHLGDLCDLPAGDGTGLAAAAHGLGLGCSGSVQGGAPPRSLSAKLDRQGAVEGRDGRLRMPSTSMAGSRSCAPTPCPPPGGGCLPSASTIVRRVEGG